MTKLKNLQIIRGCLIFDPALGTFYRVSESAVYVLKALQNDASLPALRACYAARYAVPLSTAARDIELFFNEVRR
jgi:hypothetical protein